MLTRKLPAFGVRQEPVSGAGNVLEMAGNRHEAERLGMDFEIGKAFGPFDQIVDGKIERVKDGAGDGGNIGMGPAEPGLGVGGGGGRVFMEKFSLGIRSGSLQRKMVGDSEQIGFVVSHPGDPPQRIAGMGHPVGVFVLAGAFHPDDGDLGEAFLETPAV